MKILWLCSQPLNIIAEKLGLPPVYLGGWLEGIAVNLSKRNDVQLYYLFINEEKIGVYLHQIQNINFIEFGTKGLNSKEVNIEFEALEKRFNFDLIHIFGTENYIINKLIKKVDSNKIVVSIQGILIEIFRMYRFEIFKYYKYPGLVTQVLGNLLFFYNRNQLYFRSKSEIKLLSHTENVIGRTDWDKTFINLKFPSINYFHNGEILRSEFYSSDKWDVSNITKHRIFVSQGSYPIKGLHFILKSLSILKSNYPSLELIIAGENILNNKAITSKMGISYSNFIKNIIERENLSSNVQFLGALDASQMINELLKCNCFVLASTIENSPNSLGEAMMLGVPCISSNVGGIPSMVQNGHDCILFESGNAEELARQIDSIFSEDINLLSLSNNAIETANLSYNRENNINQLVEIYKKINTNNE